MSPFICIKRFLCFANLDQKNLAIEVSIQWSQLFNPHPSPSFQSQYGIYAVGWKAEGDAPTALWCPWHICQRRSGYRLLLVQGWPASNRWLNRRLCGSWVQHSSYIAGIKNISGSTAAVLFNIVLGLYISYKTNSGKLIGMTLPWE